jgi:hypothetical protein
LTLQIYKNITVLETSEESKTALNLLFPDVKSTEETPIFNGTKGSGYKYNIICNISPKVSLNKPLSFL